MTKRIHVHAKTVEEYLTRKSKVDPLTGCIEWLGASNGYGYGSVRKLKWGTFYKVTGAHMLSYIVHIGDYDRSLFVCHTCDNPLCINPNHLWLGTAKQNTQDMLSKDRGYKPNHYGENNPNNKINKYAVQFIRDTMGIYNNNYLAKIFNIHTDYVGRIRSNKVWRNIEVGDNFADMKNFNVGE